MLPAVQFDAQELGELFRGFKKLRFLCLDAGIISGSKKNGPDQEDNEVREEYVL